jgi:hypothetical protein
MLTPPTLYLGFVLQVPAIQVFGIDITHPGKIAGARSKAAVVGSLDPAFCRWEQDQDCKLSLAASVPCICLLQDCSAAMTLCTCSCCSVFQADSLVCQSLAQPCCCT